MNLDNWIRRSSIARQKSHKILAQHERSRSRVIHLEELTKLLDNAPIDVQDYFKEALTCLEHSLFRAAIVTAWAGHFSMFSETLYKRCESDIKKERPKWNFKDLNELRESYPESQILDVAKEVKFTSNANLRILQGQLSLRNQCAHPTIYRPSLNESIGYTDAVIKQTLTYLQISRNLV